MPDVPANPDSVQNLWNEFLASIGECSATTSKTFTAWHFCDNAEDADELVELVLAGTKRATAGAMLEYEAESEPLPHPGQLSVITDGAGKARCVIQTTRVEVVPFRDVSEEFAAMEGEGDKSLDDWREAHWKFFSRTLSVNGFEASEDMLIVCERFAVVHSPTLVNASTSWDMKAADWDEQVGEEGDMNRRLNSDPVLWRFAGEVDGLDVLDAGCGTGYLSRELTRRGARVVGVDFSPEMIAIAQTRATEQGLAIDHRVGDCSHLFIGEGPQAGSFDLAFSNYVLMDLADLNGNIRSLFQALRPGGMAVLVFSHPCFPQGETTLASDDPRDPSVRYHWSHNYFEPRAFLEPAWGRFDSAFPSYHRPLSSYFAAFRAAGFEVTDLEEPRLLPERFHLVKEARRKHRSQLLPYSIAFRLRRPQK
ncbi:MAG: hypothetical protein ACI9F9_000289 [Candidatus Paceibacteria bacterium]|jgi:uncharacterized protein YhfF/SAM-dependent methyltransferase